MTDYKKVKMARNTFENLMKRSEKLKEYEAIGTVEQIQFMKSVCDMSDDMLKSLADSIRARMKYEAIGTVEEFKALKEKNEPKKAEYRKMVYPRHKWMEEDGKIDEFAYSSGYCNGPMCERCYYSFCEHCNPDGWEEECIVEDYICPSCGEKVNRKNTHCKCGQKLDWQ